MLSFELCGTLHVWMSKLPFTQGVSGAFLRGPYLVKTSRDNSKEGGCSVFVANQLLACVSLHAAGGNELSPQRSC